MHTTPHTPETRQKIREAHLGKHYSPATEFTSERASATNKGRVMSDETKRKLSESKKGQPAWNKGKTGFHHSKATKLKISQSTKGAGGNNWKGGITPANKLDRTSYQYRAWQSAVFHRDNYTFAQSITTHRPWFNQKNLSGEE